jgi:uncharacterized protein YecT (DUF1311 family)
MKLALTLILFAASSLCHAAEVTFTAQHDACLEAADGAGPLERLECHVEETKRQGALLDAAYKAALKAVPQAKQPNLREAQRTWLKFSDQNCNLFHNAESGANPAESRAYCVMRMTAERRAELVEIEAAAAGRG